MKKTNKKTAPSKTGAGKGDKPRNCFSDEYKENYEKINWENKKKDSSKQ